MIPGMMHCGGGNAFDRFDLLGPLVEWVESGKAPERPAGEPGRRRPVAPAVPASGLSALYRRRPGQGGKLPVPDAPDAS